MPHATVPAPGLQALILCGPGLSLNTFTSNPSDLPKALVPIANRPMVWYPLDWCYRMGITDIMLISPPDAAGPLEAALATHPALTSLPNPRPEILAPKELEQTTGTAELLRLPEVQAAITSDFVVLPCDLVSEMDGSAVVQQWMTLNPPSPSIKTQRARSGGLSVFYPTGGREGISHKKDETDFLATVPLPKSSVPPPAGSLRPHISEVVLSMPTDTLNDTLDDNKQALPIRQRLLERHGRVKMQTKHRDAHVYIFPHWVKDFAARNERFESLSEDLLGWWAKASWQSGLSPKLGLDSILSPSHSSGEGEGEDGAEAESDEISVAALSSTRSAPPVQEATTFASRVGFTAPPLQRPVEVPKLLAYIQPSASSQPLIRRVDTSAALAAVSLYLARQPAEHVLAHEHKVHPTASVGQQSRISQEDSLVAENVKIGIRCNVKESVIGANCEIGNNVRLLKCVLMDGVVVGDGVQLTSCIVGRRARVEGMKSASDGAAAAAGGGGVEGEGVNSGKGGKKGKKAGDASREEEEERTRLTECEVAPGFVVEAGTEVKGETLKAGLDESVDGDGDEDGGEEMGL